MIFKVFAFAKPKEELQETSEDLETFCEDKMEESRELKLTNVDLDMVETKEE